MYTACRTANDTQTLSANGDVVFVPDQHQVCVFPFHYNKKEYFECTTDGACLSCFWCGTQFNVTDDSGWGMCEESCAKEGKYISCPND